MLVRYRSGAPATTPAPRQASEPQPEPAYDQEETAGTGGERQRDEREVGCPRVSLDLTVCLLSSPQGTSRSLKVRTRKKTVPSDLGS